MTRHSPLSDDATLLASEITTNAVIHGSWQPGATLTVDCLSSNDSVLVSVTGPGRFEISDMPRAGPGGYGLALVERLSDRWGVEEVEDGHTRVWFELTRDAGPVIEP